MKGVVFRAPYDLRLEDVDDPRVESPGDVIVEVELAAICGSDLHPYRGREEGLEPGTVMGHEFLGTVVARGAEVRSFKEGDRVVAPFTTSCGECPYCLCGLTARCERGQLFGWIENGEGLHGGQAESVRVPLADTTLAKVPEATPPEAALFAGDILSTGLFAADMAGVAAGATVAVLGCGPVGLMAIVACRQRGAAEVLAIDPVPERRSLAQSLGAVALGPRGPEGAHTPASARRVDSVLEMVGSQEASRLAFELVRPGGTIAAAGVHSEAAFAFSPGDAYDKNLTYRAGRCPVRAYLEEALEVAAVRSEELVGIVTDRVGLEDAVEAYRRFDRRQDGCVKVLLVPERP
ncbi:MAG: alcohol dehydrogenase catalytic domain-containing protein [Thermoanaerobaculia bacterium]